MWLIAPPVILFALSYVWSPCFFYRYMLYISAPLFILVAAGVTAIRRPVLRCAMLALVLIPLAFQAMLIYTAPYRAPWESTARGVDIAAPREVPVIGIEYHNVYALKFFMKTTRPAIEAKSVEEAAARVKESLAARQPVMAVVSDPKMRGYLASARFEEILRRCNIEFEKTTFTSSIPIHLYKFAVTGGTSTTS
jgi:hypothetical protein